MWFDPRSSNLALYREALSTHVQTSVTVGPPLPSSRPWPGRCTRALSNPDTTPHLPELYVLIILPLWQQLSGRIYTMARLLPVEYGFKWNDTPTSIILDKEKSKKEMGGISLSLGVWESRIGLWA